jgi:hypothetical protein
MYMNMELAALRDITEGELHRVRKANGLVSIYDVIRAVTGHEATTIRKTWQRLIDFQPELQTICIYQKFHTTGRGSNQESPATDAKGIVKILMALPGKAAAGFRQKAATTIVRYIGGDLSLIQEVMDNNAAQQRLAHEDPENPALLFSEAVGQTASSSLPDARYWDERRAKTEAIIATYKLAKDAGIEIGEAHRKAASDIINEIVLPPGKTQEEMVDAAEILKRKGHTPLEILRMSSEIGRALKTAASHLRKDDGATTNLQLYGAGANDVCMYHCLDDALLIDVVYDKFKERSLYATACGEDSRRAEFSRAVGGALRGARGFAQSGSKKPRRG